MEKENMLCVCIPTHTHTQWSIRYYSNGIFIIIQESIFYLKERNPPFVTACMDLEGISVSEISQRKTDTVWSHLYVESRGRTPKPQTQWSGSCWGKKGDVGQRVQTPENKLSSGDAMYNLTTKAAESRFQCSYHLHKKLCEVENNNYYMINGEIKGLCCLLSFSSEYLPSHVWKWLFHSV